MLDKLNDLDTPLFLYINGKHNPFFDEVMYWASDKLFWDPFYAAIVILIICWYKKKALPSLCR